MRAYVSTASRRARVQAKIKLDPEYACEYCKFMSDYEALGQMRAIRDSTLPPDSSRVFTYPTTRFSRFQIKPEKPEGFLMHAARLVPDRR